MPAVDALKQQNRGQPVVEPGQLPGELHARRTTTTDQPRLWLVIHVWIIGVRECRHGTGNIVRRASVEATSVMGDRARARRFRRIRTVRIDGRPAPPAAALAGPCGQVASPHWGHSGAVSRSFRTSIELGEHDGHCMRPVRGHFRVSRSTAQYCSPTCRKASARFRTVSVPQTQKRGRRLRLLTAAYGTSLTSRDVRLESAKRANADHVIRSLSPIAIL